jgi:hypothetical protein
LIKELFLNKFISILCGLTLTFCNCIIIVRYSYDLFKYFLILFDHLNELNKTWLIYLNQIQKIETSSSILTPTVILHHSFVYIEQLSVLFIISGQERPPICLIRCSEKSFLLLFLILSWSKLCREWLLRKYLMTRCMCFIVSSEKECYEFRHESTEYNCSEANHSESGTLDNWHLVFILRMLIYLYS